MTRQIDPNGPRNASWPAARETLNRFASGLRTMIGHHSSSTFSPVCADTGRRIERLKVVGGLAAGQPERRFNRFPCSGSSSRCRSG